MKNTKLSVYLRLLYSLYIFLHIHDHPSPAPTPHLGLRSTLASTEFDRPRFVVLSLLLEKTLLSDFIDDRLDLLGPTELGSDHGVDFDLVWF